MTRKDFTTIFSDLLLECMAKPDPIFHLLEWLCAQLMEAEVHEKLSACKSKRTEEHSGYRSGYRVRKWDTRMGTMCLLIPKLRSGSYIPFFLTAHKRSEAALVQVVQEAYNRAFLPARWKNSSRALVSTICREVYVSELTKGLNDQAEEFRSRILSGDEYPVI